MKKKNDVPHKVLPELNLPWYTRYLQGLKSPPEPPTTDKDIVEQKGWLSPGSQIQRLIEAGERLDNYRMENYDEYFYGEDEPSLDPIRKAEDIQDELLHARKAIQRMKDTETRLTEEHKKRLEEEEKKLKEKETPPEAQPPKPENEPTQEVQK
jgi:hypothetical protein